LRWSLPNLLTASRLPLALVFGALLFTGHSRATLLAVFALAAVTDLFDGIAARRLGQVTRAGAVLDQWVDRGFTALVVGFLGTHAALAGDLATLGLLALACAREIVALPGVAILRVRGKPLYHVEFVGKLATFAQSVTLGAIVAAVPFAPALALVCAAIGVASGASYLRYALAAERA